MTYAKSNVNFLFAIDLTSGELQLAAPRCSEPQRHFVRVALLAGTATRGCLDQRYRKLLVDESYNL